MKTMIGVLILTLSLTGCGMDSGDRRTGDSESTGTEEVAIIVAGCALLDFCVVWALCHNSRMDR